MPSSGGNGNCVLKRRSVSTSVSGFVALVTAFACSTGSDAVPHGPVGIELHVKLTLLTGHLIVTRLFFSR